MLNERKLGTSGLTLEATLEAFDRLMRAGKVRAIGASNYTAPRLERALDASAAKGIARYSVLQPLYNLLERTQFEGPLQDRCVARNIAALPYFGLASGFLTGNSSALRCVRLKARSTSHRCVAQPTTRSPIARC